MPITSADLVAISNGDVTHLHLAQYYPLAACRRLTEWAIEHPEIQNYRVSDSEGRLTPSDTLRLGLPLSEFYSVLLGNNPAREPEVPIDQYFDHAARLMSEAQRVCSPFCTPIETLTKELVDIWPGGATLAKLKGQSVFAGIIRIMRPVAARALPEPHIDWVPDAIFKLTAQLSAIAYLSMPDAEGELEVWSTRLDALIDLVNRQGRLRRRDLPEPTLIRPQTGDVVIINTRRAHAVRSFGVGARIVQTAFIGVNKWDAPVIMWS